MWGLAVHLVIQIPCFNEEENIAAVLRALPSSSSFPKGTKVSVLIINDGSTDSTLEQVNQVRDLDIRILDLKRNVGLAQAFEFGIIEAISWGADIIVNTDGDGQYLGSEIPQLCQPIFDGGADIVIGDRGVGSVKEFSKLKRVLQTLGSMVTSKLVGVTIGDATSGFRAYRAEMIAGMVLTSKFSYTLESLVQMKALRARINTVPISRIHTERPSRLFRSNVEYIRKNGLTLIRTSLRYRPIPVFAFFSICFLIFGIVSWLPVITSLFSGGGNHIQSEILGGVFVVGALMCMMIGIVADAVLQNILISHRVIGAHRLSMKNRS
jgi:glycosyltransferase involved in cell wall biosynthesis